MKLHELIPIAFDTELQMSCQNMRRLLILNLIRRNHLVVRIEPQHSIPHYLGEVILRTFKTQKCHI